VTNGNSPADIEWSQEVEAAAWIEKRLHPFGHNDIGSVVPEGFDSYVRLLHPCRSGPIGERVVRWSEVAQWSGRQVNGSISFEELSKPSGPVHNPFPWFEEPEQGTLTRGDTEALVSILSAYTATPEQCWFCVWNGYGWDRHGPLHRRGTPKPEYLPDPIPAKVRNGRLVRLPGREYYLYRGPIAQALTFVDYERQSPNLWWPEDRLWCVASEIDLCWTYVGGSRDMTDAILSDDRLESVGVLICDPVVA
jgi:hypothetical protein